MLQRWKDYFIGTFLKGTTPRVDRRLIEAIEKIWPTISEEGKLKLIEKLEKEVRNKRESMGENAARGNYKFTGLAFIAAAGVSALFATTNTSTPSKVILLSCISVLFASAGILLIVISAKSKVMRKKLNYVPTGIMRAREVHAAEYYYQLHPEMMHWYDWLEATIDLHKCEIILMIERRASWVASRASAIAVFAMIPGLALAFV